MVVFYVGEIGGAGALDLMMCLWSQGARMAYARRRRLEALVGDARLVGPGGFVVMFGGVWLVVVFGDHCGWIYFGNWI